MQRSHCETLKDVNYILCGYAVPSRVRSQIGFTANRDALDTLLLCMYNSVHQHGGPGVLQRCDLIIDQTRGV